MSKPNEKLEAIFEAAVALKTEAQRADYLDRACPDPELRRELESLLAAHQNPDSVFAETTVRVEATPSESVGTVIGRYKLLEALGEGGFGLVWLAEQKEPVRRKVALKVIKLGMDTKQVVARFEAERQALALMDHPNIAKVLDGGATDSGRPYFVMELVRGIPITKFCDENKLATRERLDLFIKVCHAVQHAHQKGIIHRDLKPSNVMVTLHDGVPVPKVIDFGIAKATQQELTDKTIHTLFQQFIGTPAYVSPEQAEMSGLDIDTRSDIYSLGVLLYELLAGSTPFDAKELMASGLDAMRKTIREVEPVKPSTRLTQARLANLSPDSAPSALHIPHSAIADDLDWVVMKCLEKDRARRYDTANGLAADLTRHLNDEPVVARPPSRLYEFQKTVRRHKFGFAAAAAILLVLAGGITLTTWQAVRATRAERQQSVARAETEKARQNEAGLRQTAQTEANRAEAAATDSKRTLSAADFRQGVRLIAEDNANDALPYLARSLSFNPANDAALTRLATLLGYHTWMLPTLVLKHEKSVNSAEFSPDGKRIVTASADGAARVWDAQSGQPLLGPMKHAFSVTSAQFSPDEKRIVTISEELTVRVWDAQTGQPVTAPMKHRSLVTSVQFSPDGKRIVTGSFDNTARVWDAGTGKPLTEPLVHDNYFKEQEEKQRRAAGIYSVNQLGHHPSVDGKTSVSFDIDKAVRAQFSPEGERIVTASEGGSARVWDTQTGQPLTGPMKHVSGVASAQFSPDGKRIITVSQDGTTRVWDAQTGQPLADTMFQGKPARSKQLSPDEKRKISISSGGIARVLDAKTGRPLTAPMKHGGDVSAAQFSPDGERILTASGDNAAYLWEARTGPPLPLRPPLPLFHGSGGHSQWGPYSRPQFSHDGRRIVMPSRDNTARVWDAHTGEPLTRMNHDTNVASAQFSPDDQRIVTTTWDYNAKASTVRVWDARTGQPVSEPMKHGNAVYSAHFSPDGRRIVTASYDTTARVWDAQTGQPLTEPMRHRKGVITAEFSPDGRSIVTASYDTTARVWDAQTGQPLTEPMKHTSSVASAQFSPDGKRIVTASFDSTARVWEAQTGQPVTEPMKHGDSVNSAQFSPDGKRIVTTSDDRTARVWDAQTGQPVTEPIKPGGPVYTAQFSPDGKRIVTAQSLQINLREAGDYTARVWDAQTGQPLTEPMTHHGIGHVVSAQFSPDGRRIVTATDAFDKKARVWDIAPTEAPCPDWLLQLTEAISGKVLNKEGVLEPTRLNRLETLNQIRQKLAAQPDDDWVIWGRWLLADRATRTISPFAKVTVPEYIEHLIQEKTRQSLDEAEPLAAGKPEILQRISEARETLEPPKK